MYKGTIKSNHDMQGVSEKTQSNDNLKSLKNLQNLSRCNVYHLKVQSFFCLMICSLDILMEL